MKYLKDATIINKTEVHEDELRKFIEDRFSHFNVHFEIKNSKTENPSESFPFNLFKSAIATLS